MSIVETSNLKNFKTKTKKFSFGGIINFFKNKQKNILEKSKSDNIQNEDSSNKGKSVFLDGLNSTLTDGYEVEEISFNDVANDNKGEEGENTELYGLNVRDSEFSLDFGDDSSSNIEILSSELPKNDNLIKKLIRKGIHNRNNGKIKNNKNISFFDGYMLNREEVGLKENFVLTIGDKLPFIDNITLNIEDYKLDLYNSNKAPIIHLEFTNKLMIDISFGTKEEYLNFIYILEKQFNFKFKNGHNPTDIINSLKREKWLNFKYNFGGFYDYNSNNFIGINSTTDN